MHGVANGMFEKIENALASTGEGRNESLEELVKQRIAGTEYPLSLVQKNVSVKKGEISTIYFAIKLVFEKSDQRIIQSFYKQWPVTFFAQCPDAIT